jgi:hypothetical protein
MRDLTKLGTESRYALGIASLRRLINLSLHCLLRWAWNTLEVGFRVLNKLLEEINPINFN